MKMKELFENGTMAYLQKVGAISPTISRYKELNDQLESVQKQVECSKREAVTIVADKNKVGESMVWSAAKMMKQ